MNVIARATVTIRQWPAPQTMPTQAVSQVHAALVNP